MSLQKVVSLVFGSACVYVLVAACGGGAAQSLVALASDAASDVFETGLADYGPEGSVESGVAASVAESSRETDGLGTAIDVALEVAAEVLSPVPPAKADDTISGTRLKAYWRTAEDGSRERVPGVWYDSRLLTDCAFALATDGLERCLPSTPLSQFSNNAFSDSACSSPVALTTCMGSVPPFLLVADRGVSCSSPSTYSARSLGPAYTGQLYRYNPGGNGPQDVAGCFPLSASESAVFAGSSPRTTSVAPLSTFVSATRAAAP